MSPQPSGHVWVLSKFQGGGPDFDNTYTIAYGTDPDPYGAIPHTRSGGDGVMLQQQPGSRAGLKGWLAIPGINNPSALPRRRTAVRLTA